jgi:hypothetical protein
MFQDKPLTSSLERRKTFDSPLANHFSKVSQQWFEMYLSFYATTSMLSPTSTFPPAITLAKIPSRGMTQSPTVKKMWQRS